MTTPVWPGSLPAFERGLKDVAQDGVIRTPMDAGPVKRRRRFTAMSRYLRGTIYLTSAAQRNALDTFFDDTLQGGSLSFEMTDPKDGTQQIFAFISPPEYDHQYGEDNNGTEQYRVSLALERLP